MTGKWYRLYCDDCHELVVTIALPDSNKPYFHLSKDGFATRFIFDGYTPPSVLCTECSVRRAQTKHVLLIPRSDEQKSARDPLHDPSTHPLGDNER